ncbi:MAG TPA: ABC transporter ATP-binding protein [Chloroflexi bacterium]|nr:ABC transporter ATP-binding protein [Chloroflexota bacterium]
MAALVEAEQLTKRFGDFTAVESLSLTLAEGEVLALLGPNGAGKTTTVRCMSAILRPSAGRVTVAGYDTVRHARTVRRLVGLLTEFPGLYGRMQPLEYLDFFGALQGIPAPLRAQRAESLLTRFGLWEIRGRRLSQFSKGMRQKMALVRAMLHEPQILFLDEPTSALDPQGAKQVRDVIAQLRAAGHTILLCTHNLAEAEELADRIAIVAAGRVLAVGSAVELKRARLGPPLYEIRFATELNGLTHEVTGLVDVTEMGEGWLRYRVDAPAATNPALLRHLARLGAEVVTLSEVPQSLESAYLDILEQGGGLATPRILEPSQSTEGLPRLVTSGGRFS